MGKVKAWVMDMEEEFFDYVTEDDLTNAETFQEFVAVAKNKIPLSGSFMTTSDIEYTASTIWNDYWQNYI